MTITRTVNGRAQQQLAQYRAWSNARRDDQTDASQSYSVAKVAATPKPDTKGTDYDLWTDERNERFEFTGYSEAVTNPAPELNTEKDRSYPHQPATLSTQEKIFGALTWAGRIKSSSTSYKVWKKYQALARTLNAAFTTVC